LPSLPYCPPTSTSTSGTAVRGVKAQQRDRPHQYRFRRAAIRRHDGVGQIGERSHLALGPAAAHVLVALELLGFGPSLGVTLGQNSVVGVQMDMVDRSPVSIPHGLDLAGNAHRVDHEEAARRGAADIVLDIAHQRILDPAAAIGLVEPLARALQGRAVFLDLRQLFADQVARLDQLGVITRDQFFSERRLAGTDRSRQYDDAQRVMGERQMRSSVPVDCRLGGRS
jgi:hypothetical protein